MQHTGTFVYGGSFDPCHKAHLWVVKFLTTLTHKKIVVVPSYQGVGYVATGHEPAPAAKTHWLSFATRRQLLLMSLQDHCLKGLTTVHDVEKHLARPSSTMAVLRRLHSEYPHAVASSGLWWVMGQDQLRHFHQWHHAYQLLQSFNLCVFPRPISPTHQTLPEPPIHSLTRQTYALMERLDRTKPLLKLRRQDCQPTYDLYTLAGGARRVMLIKLPPPTISSTHIRQHLATAPPPDQTPLATWLTPSAQTYLTRPI